MDKEPLYLLTKSPDQQVIVSALSVLSVRQQRQQS